MPTANEPLQREIRVFISSTFRDMQEEREELVKQIFPQLRRLCEGRGVTWGEVDLRWGVPDEAKSEGKVLPLCLAEIERCRPYFIGLLGERYGWVPEEIPDELLEAQPWLTKHRKDSVTALEILHGVLLNPDMAGHAFFYFRDPAYAASHAGFIEEDPTRRKRLTELKEKIRDSGFPVAENFDTPEQLGELVLRDMTAVIENLFPESSVPDPLDRASADHEAYAASRRRVYIGRPEYIERLDAHAAGDGPPLVVLGESGGGKSALLANWAHGWSKQHPETPVIVHFIGAAPDSADWIAMLRRLMGEFQRRVGIQIKIPDQPDALREAFANALSMAAARGPVVLALDALNQIEDRDGAPDLVWLPTLIPANVRLIVSTLPGRPLDDLRKRAWPVLAVEPLEPFEREALIVDYLARYAKALSAGPARRIAAAPQTGNGLYLTTLLNELRQFGSYEGLDARIGWYLEAVTPVELFGKVIQRWEQDYEERDPGGEDIVGESMSRLWAARRGLSETELLESLGMEGSPLPRAIWSPLFLATADSLVNRGGLLTFAHDFLREAVRESYLPTAGHQQSAHRTLAAYFRCQPSSTRQLEELLWQLQEAAEWQSLADLLAQPDFLPALDQFELAAYWTRIEAHSPLRMEQTYAAAIRDPMAYRGEVISIAELLSSTGKREVARRMFADIAGSGALIADLADGDDYARKAYLGLLFAQAETSVREDLDGSMALIRKAERLAQEFGYEEELVEALSAQARILTAQGDRDGAMAMYKEQERFSRGHSSRGDLASSLLGQETILSIRGDLDGALSEAERRSRELGDKGSLLGVLLSQAGVLKSRGDLDGALALCKEQEGLCRELGNKEALSDSLLVQATILSSRGDTDGAMALCKDAERLSRESGNKAGLASSLLWQGTILEDLGDMDGAIALVSQAERLGRELGAKDVLRVALGKHGAMLQMRGDLEDAMELYKEEESLCRELGNREGLQRSLGDQASILKDGGDLDDAMALYKEQESLCRELGNNDVRQVSLGNQADILFARWDLDGAMALYKEQESLGRELGNKDSLQKSLGSQALILETQRDMDGAMALYKEQESLCRELNNKHVLQNSLGNQADILAGRGDLDGAMALYKEQESLCREVDYKEGLRSSVGDQALILKDRGDLDGAMEMYKEEESLCRELGNNDLLQVSLGSQADILIARGDLDGAMALHKEQESLCRELGYKDGLQKSLGSQALILKARGDLDGAMSLYKGEESLCRELNYKYVLQNSLGNQADILIARGDVDGALALYKEQESLCREVGYKDGLQNSLGDQAAILYDRGDLDGAMAAYKERGLLCGGLGDKDGLQISLWGQANVLYSRGDLDGALALYKEQESLCRELGNQDGLQNSLGNQALVLDARGDLDGAMALHKEQESLRRELGL